MSAKLHKSDIIEGKLAFSDGDYGTYSIMQKQYFMKYGNKLIAFPYENEMFASKEFIKNIKSKNFRLNTEEDGVAFQSMLKLFDNERGLGFFEEDDIWYFIRDEFFDDIKAYVVTTDNKGQVLSIVYEGKLEKQLPEILLKPGNLLQNNNIENTDISGNDML